MSLERCCNPSPLVCARQITTSEIFEQLRTCPLSRTNLLMHHTRHVYPLCEKLPFSSIALQLRALHFPTALFHLHGADYTATSNSSTTLTTHSKHPSISPPPTCRFTCSPPPIPCEHCHHPRITLKLHSYVLYPPPHFVHLQTFPSHPTPQKPSASLSKRATTYRSSYRYYH